MSFLRRIVVCAAIAMPAAVVHAEDAIDRGGLEWEQAADRVVAARAAGADALAGVLREAGVDPWLLVDALVRRQAWAEADAVVGAGKGVRSEGLAAYLAAQRVAPVAAPVRDARDRAVIAARAGDVGRALELLDAAPPGGDTVPAAASAFLRGMALLSLKRPEEAIDAFRRAADAADRIGWIEQEHRALQQGGRLAFQARLADVALELLRRQAPLAEKVATPEDFAGCVINIGSMYAVSHRWDEAITWLRRGLDLTLPGAGGDPKKMRSYRLNDLVALGQLHFHRGEYAHAVAVLDEAPALAVALDRPRERGIVLLFLGKARLALELTEAGAKAYGEAADVFAGLGDAVRLRDALRGEAACLLDQGDAAGALEVHDRIAGLGGNADLPPAERIQDLGERALALQDAGRLDEAAAAYGEALALATAANDEDDATWVRINQATLWCARGRFADARPLLETALSAAERGHDAYFERHARRWLAAVELAQGHPAAARLQVDRGLARAGTLLVGLSDAEAARARASLTALLDEGLRAAAAEGDAAAGLRYAETGRGLAFLEMLGARAHDAAAALPPELVAEVGAAGRKVVEARERLAAVPPDAERVVLRDARRALDAELEAMERARRAVERVSKLAAEAVAPQAADAGEIARALDADQALVTYAVTDGTLVAFVLRSDGATRRVALGEAAPVEPLIEALHAVASDASATPDAGPLRERLVVPLALGDDIRRVVVVPYAALHEVPFGVLMPDREVAYAPSGTVLSRLGRPEPAPDASVLALGNPDYGAAAARSSAAGPRAGVLAALPATATEVRAIAGARGDVTLLAADATEDRFRSTLGGRARWHGVHFACHGLLDVARPALSSLALTPGGLDDGFLTALEVGSMSIAADLVVLSACETSRGRVEVGEGVLGLTRSFMLAGVPRVVCSLWKVDDEATRALMIRFYELWRPAADAGRPPLPAARALREAQAFVRDHPDHPRWKHPYYWAAWVLWGLPR